MNIVKRSEPQLTLGGMARANLLPPEVGLAVQAKVLHRGLSILVVAMIVVVGAGFGGATFYAMQTRQALDAETARTADLLAQQAKFSEVRKVTNALKLSTAARQVGSSTAIDWESYVQAIQGSLPVGTAITTFTADSGSPMAAFAQATVPLQGARIAELTFTATSPSLPDVQVWLDGLAKLTGFVDASPGSVTLEGTTYKVSITMHISDAALSNQYAPPKNGTTNSNTGAASTSGTGK
jgi:hypothetical protein